MQIISPSQKLERVLFQFMPQRLTYDREPPDAYFHERPSVTNRPRTWPLWNIGANDDAIFLAVFPRLMGRFTRHW